MRNLKTDIYHNYPLLHMHSTAQRYCESGTKIETELGWKPFECTYRGVIGEWGHRSVHEDQSWHKITRRTKEKSKQGGGRVLDKAAERSTRHVKIGMSSHEDQGISSIWVLYDRPTYQQPGTDMVRDVHTYDISQHANVLWGLRYFCSMSRCWTGLDRLRTV